MVAIASTAAATWNPRSLVEPRYTGLLSRAPSVVGDFKDIVDRFGQYRSELAGLVTNVTKLYGATSTLQTFSADPNTVRVLHVSDLHLNPVAWSVIGAIADEFKVDVIVDTGDLTDHGSTAEDAFANDISRLKRPYIFIKGNHDSDATVAAVKEQPNAIVLDYSSVTVSGITFYGAPDPRFTPDRVGTTNNDTTLSDSGSRMANGLRLLHPSADVALVHDPVVGEKLSGTVPLVLAGHIHKREVRKLPDNTLMLVEGSTGGAGLRALEHEKPTPVECSVLYFDRSTGTLLAYDDITIGGLGLASATIDRHLVEKPATAEPSPSPSGDALNPARIRDR
jgi:predicted MPP superfamily phosphohydrolase